MFDTRFHSCRKFYNKMLLFFILFSFMVLEFEMVVKSNREHKIVHILCFWTIYMTSKWSKTRFSTRWKNSVKKLSDCPDWLLVVCIIRKPHWAESRRRRTCWGRLLVLHCLVQSTGLATLRRSVEIITNRPPTSHLPHLGQTLNMLLTTQWCWRCRGCRWFTLFILCHLCCSNF